MIVESVGDEDPSLDDCIQKRYQQGVGSLMYLVKHSRPDISNPVRELSKGMKRANNAHLKSLHRLISFVVNTKERGLLIKPLMDGKMDWKMEIFSDSDWASDRDTRKSVNGWSVFLCGSLICWGSRSQKHVTLSSTEAEYVAVSEASREIFFIKSVLEFMNVNVKRPITIRVDNLGAIYLDKNSGGKRSKHIEVRYHHIREKISDGSVEIIFVKSEENIADGFTKNLPEELFQKHSKVYMNY